MEGRAAIRAESTHWQSVGQILEVKPVDIESGLFTFVQLANPNQRNKPWRNYQGLITPEIF
jgi:hypothetical protein